MGQEKNQPEAGFIADRRLFLTGDGRVVEEGDPAAAFQLAAPGSPIEPAEVSRLGLEMKGDKISQKSPPVGIPVPGGALLDPRGAVEAAVKDRLKADWEVRVKEETNKEMDRIKSEVEDGGNAHGFALNRAGAISREALRRRGEAPLNEEVDRSAEVLEGALASAPPSQEPDKAHRAAAKGK